MEDIHGEALRRKGWRGKGKGQKSRHFVHQTIEERPQEANRRSEIGHWEGDLVYSSFYKLYVVTTVDRKSRFLLTGNSYSRKAQEVSDVICRLLKKLPEKHVRSLTLIGDRNFQNTIKLQRRFLPCKFILRIPCRRGKEGQTSRSTACCGSTFPKHLSSSVFCRAIGRVYRKAESSSSQMPQLELPL